MFSHIPVNVYRDHSARGLILFSFAIALLLYMGWAVRSTLLLIYGSIVLAVVLLPLVEWVQKLRIFGWHPGRGLSILTLLACAAILVGVLLLFVVPRVAGDLQSLADSTPTSLNQLRNQVRHLPFGDTIASSIGNGTLTSHMAALLKGGLHSISALFGAVTNLALMVILICYLMLGGQRSFRWWCSLLPTKTQGWLPGALQKGANRMQRWLRGQALLMLILGSASFIVFWALGLRYFYLLAVFAGLANFVPILGPIATVIAAGLVALLDSPMKLLGVVIFYLVYQQVENAYLTPRIMKSAVQLSGAAVVTALAIGGGLGGILGAIIAVPSAALVVTVVEEARNRSENSSAADIRRAA